MVAIIVAIKKLKRGKKADIIFVDEAHLLLTKPDIIQFRSYLNLFLCLKNVLTILFESYSYMVFLYFNSKLNILMP